MRKSLKAGAVAATGFLVGLVTLRSIRQRRAEQQTPTEPKEAALNEANAAAEHATEAMKHTVAASKNAVEYKRRETRQSENDQETPKPTRRLRKVGKGWIRR